MQDSTSTVNKMSIIYLCGGEICYCSYEVIIFIAKRNYFVVYMLTVKLIFLQMNPSMPSENGQEKIARVILNKIADVLCYPKFKCIHLVDPGQEQLKKYLYRYKIKKMQKSSALVTNDYI